jgi:hypothetical protein
MADEAIGDITRINTLAPEQPFFVYYVPAHARATSSDAGVDQKDQRHAPVQQVLDRFAQGDFRQPEARRGAAGRQAYAVTG